MFISLSILRLVEKYNLLFLNIINKSIYIDCMLFNFNVINIEELSTKPNSFKVDEQFLSKTI